MEIIAAVMQCDFIPDYYVYTDGACSGNGKPSAKAGIGVFFGLDDPRNVSEFLNNRLNIKNTNNIAELTAMLRAFSIIQDDLDLGKHVAICTDSEYVIRCATTYGRKCHAEKWKNEIPNKQMVQDLYNLYEANKSNVRLLYVRGHTGGKDDHSVGNEHADRLANLAIGVDTTRTKNIFDDDRRIYLRVAYEEKEAAKKLGAKWDANRKKWYVLQTNTNMNELCEKYGYTNDDINKSL